MNSSDFHLFFRDETSKVPSKAPMRIPILNLYVGEIYPDSKYSLFRFQFSKLNIPFFSMKGSFVVANAGAEGQVRPKCDKDSGNTDDT